MTAYAMNLQLFRDGGERGLWIFLDDRIRQPPVREAVLLDWAAVRALYARLGAALRQRDAAT